MSRSAERAKNPGPRSGSDNDGDSPALLATTTIVGTFPHWPATTMATRRDAQLINVVRKLGRTHMGNTHGEHTWGTRFVCRRPSEIGEQEQVLSVYHVSGCVSGCFLKLLVISYRDHITNEEVKARIVNTIGPYKDLLTSVKRRKLEWYGHVTLSSGLAKTILQGTVQGGR